MSTAQLVSHGDQRAMTHAVHKAFSGISTISEEILFFHKAQIITYNHIRTLQNTQGVYCKNPLIPPP